MNRSLIVAAVACTLAVPAHAGTKAWKALEKKLPAKTMGVGAIDVDGMRAKVKDFAKLFEQLTKLENDVEELVGVIKSECAIDVATAVDDIAFALDDSDDGVVVIALKGLDEKKVTACGQKLFAKFEAGKKLTVKTGKITAYGLGSPGDEVYAAWLAPDVVAIGTDPDKKDRLEAMLAGAGATGDLAGYIGTVSSSQGWAAVFPNENDLKSVLVTGNVVGADAKVTMRMITPDAKAGAKMLADLKQEFDKEATKKKNNAPAVVKFFKTAKVTGKGAEVTVDLTAPTPDIPAILPAL